MLNTAVTMGTFSPYNRARTIGNSQYRICRNQNGQWYIHEIYNNLEAGEWAMANFFYDESLQSVIDKLNSFTKEKEVVSSRL